MFKTIARLLFGGQEEVPEDIRSGEELDDGWLVVPHQEAASPGSHDGLVDDTQRSDVPPHRDTRANVESDSLLDAEPTSINSSTTAGPATSGSVLQSRVLTERTRLTCIKKAKAWADRHHVSHSAIHRQNRVRQGVQHYSFHLQQPAHRSLSH
uniref:Tumor protein p53 inducible nuclear protein 2 n=1 Tax=Nothobranchius pienaari TaxID=704102 RepID=A0A1A8NJZ0_9TELE